MTILWTHPPERLLASVGANVLPQVAERRKVLCASLRFTVERLACVESLVCFQSADTIAAASLKVKPKRRRQSENCGIKQRELGFWVSNWQMEDGQTFAF